MSIQYYVLMAVIVGVYLLYQNLVATPRKLHTMVAGNLTLGQTYRMRMVCEILKDTVLAKNVVKIYSGHYEVTVFLTTDGNATKLTLLGGHPSQMRLSVGVNTKTHFVNDNRPLEEHYLECLESLIIEHQIDRDDSILHDATLIGAAMLKRGWRKK